MDFKTVKEESPLAWEELKKWFRALDFVAEDKVQQIKVKSECIDLIRQNGRTDRVVLRDLYGFFEDRFVYVGVYPNFNGKLELKGFTAKTTWSGPGHAKRQRAATKEDRQTAEQHAFGWAFDMLEASLTPDEVDLDSQ